MGNTCHSPLAEICCHDLADVTLVNVRGAVMQQVLIDLCLEGMKVQLCLPFLPPRARLVLDRDTDILVSSRNRGEIPGISSEPSLRCGVCSGLWHYFLVGQGKMEICMA